MYSINTTNFHCASHALEFAPLHCIAAFKLPTALQPQQYKSCVCFLVHLLGLKGGSIGWSMGEISIKIQNKMSLQKHLQKGSPRGGPRVDPQGGPQGGPRAKKSIKSAKNHHRNICKKTCLEKCRQVAWRPPHQPSKTVFRLHETTVFRNGPEPSKVEKLIEKRPFWTSFSSRKWTLAGENVVAR